MQSASIPTPKLGIARLLLLLAGGATLPSLAVASCGAAFCAVNTNWTAESAQLEPGSSFDLRYESIRQDQPRTGSDKIAVGQVRRHHDEVRTRNRNLLATYSRNFDSQWGLSVTVPLVDRDHVHIHNHHGAQLDERWKFAELGDARVVGRYELPYIGDPRRPVTTGFTIGLKLPTGKTTVANGDAELAERSLQPGTGTTDAIVGAYYHQKLPSLGASWFAQAQYQQPLNVHDEYRPGKQLQIDTGYRHALTDRLAALVQLNLLAKGRDSGQQAEPDDSGGRFVSLSPGLSYALNGKMQVYGFLQQPLRQHVNGVQLTADRSLVIGVSSRF